MTDLSSPSPAGGRRRPARMRRVLLAGLLATLGSVAVTSAPAGADGDLTPSATTVRRGDTISITTTGCTPDDVDGFDAVAQIQLISGTGPDRVVAGFGEDYEGSGVRIIVPTWIDPAAPLELVAQCVSYDSETDAVFDYDPVPLDLQPDAGPVVPQSLTWSRTSALGAQGIRAIGEGCAVPGDNVEATALVWPGDDISRIPSQIEAGGFGFLEDGLLETSIPLMSYVTGRALPPGTYVALVACVDYYEEGVVQAFPPQLIEVGPAAWDEPVSASLVEGTTAIELSGGGCSSTVSLSLAAFDEGSETIFVGVASSRDGGWKTPEPTPGARGTASSRDDSFEEVEITPGPDGEWTYTWDPGITQGVAFVDAVCGDPYADGFFYPFDGAVLEIDITLPTEPPAPPAEAPPASPIPADARFTG